MSKKEELRIEHPDHRIILYPDGKLKVYDKTEEDFEKASVHILLNPNELSLLSSYLLTI